MIKHTVYCNNLLTIEINHNKYSQPKLRHIIQFHILPFHATKFIKYKPIKPYEDAQILILRIIITFSTTRIGEGKIQERIQESCLK